MDYLSWSRHFRNFPGQGDLPVRRLHGGAAADRLRRRCCRWRSSTTSSAPARRAASRSTAIARCVFMLDQLARAPAAPCRPARAAAAGDVPGRRVHRVRRRRSRRAAASNRLLRGPGLPPRRPAPLEGGDALAPGRHQPRGQHARRKASPTPSTSRTARRSARSACASTMPPRPSSARRCCSTSRSGRPSGRASSTSRRCAASAAACSTSSTSKSELGRVWDIEFDADRRATRDDDAGLTAVDHISQSMHYEEMLTWLLFYTSLLDLEKIAAAGRRRSGRAGAEPGDRGGRRRAAHRAQRLAEPAHAVVALPDARCSARACSTSPSPPTTSSGDRRAARARTACGCCRSRRTTTTTSKPRPTCRPSRSTRCEAHKSSTTARATREYLQVYTETFDQRFFFEIVAAPRLSRLRRRQRAGPAGRAGAIVRRSPLMFQPAHWEELFRQGYTIVSGAIGDDVLQAAQATAAR